LTDWQRWSALEWGILVLAAPVLLLLSFRPEATLLALITLSGFWVAALVRRCPWPITPFNGALLLFAAAVGVGVAVSAYPDLTLPKATSLILGMGLFRAVAGIQRRGARTLSLAVFLLVVMVAVPEAPQQGINPLLRNQLGGALSFLLPLPITLVLGLSLIHI